jgi:uncharacterized repeat protein (TIGR01451 family)
LDTQVTQDALDPLVIRYNGGSLTNVNNTTAATSPITAPVVMTPSTITLPATAGSGSFTVQPAITGFDWRAVSDSPWLTVTSGTGPGAGTVQYALSANATGTGRSGHITVAGEVVTLTQTTLVTAVLGITKTHMGNFAPGQAAAYTVTVSNMGGAAATSGIVTVTETPPSSLSNVSMSGGGWNCSGSSCTRGDSLAGGASYPAITVTASVASNAAVSVTNQVSVSGGGSVLASASDLASLAGFTCDINGDGVTSVADVQRIVNEALGIAAPLDDLNGDGVVNVVDTQVVIRAALGSVCAAR